MSEELHGEGEGRQERGGEGRQRLFFALWPEESVRETIAAAVRKPLRKINGRKVEADKLHITLAFLGELDAAGRECVEAAAGRVAAEPFELILDQLGYWWRPRVFWLGSRTTPAALGGLAAGLQEALAGCGFEPERRDFQAHMTLARKAHPPRREFGIEPLPWAVSEFVLVESRLARAGARYRVLRRWPLRPAP